MLNEMCEEVLCIELKLIINKKTELGRPDSILATLSLYTGEQLDCFIHLIKIDYLKWKAISELGYIVQNSVDYQ